MTYPLVSALKYMSAQFFVKMILTQRLPVLGLRTFPEWLCLQLQIETALRLHDQVAKVHILYDDPAEDVPHHASLLQLQRTIGRQHHTDVQNHADQQKSQLLNDTFATILSSMTDWHQAFVEEVVLESHCSLDQPDGDVSGQPLTAQQNSKRSFPAKVVLSLEASLPCSIDFGPQQLDDNTSALLWFHHESWADYCRSLPPIHVHPLPDGLKVPRVAYPAFLDPTLECPLAGFDWEFYVDGSTTSIGAGWSVVVIQNTDEGSCFCGQLHGQVQFDQAHEQWLGADTLDNIAAEFIAYVERRSWHFQVNSLDALQFAQTCSRAVPLQYKSKSLLPTHVWPCWLGQ